MEIQLALTGVCFVFQMMFAFCYLGNQLTTKAFEINDSIYDCDWYNYPPTIQLLTILIMKRSQKSFIMTGHFLVACSLQSFKDVSKMLLSLKYKNNFI